MQIKRGLYNEILTSQLKTHTQKKVENLFLMASNTRKLDEHGWNFGCEYDNRTGETHSLNWSLYGIGRDYFSKKLLIVVQVREFYRKKKTYFPRLRKSYFLIGRNEDNTAFAHPVSGRKVTSAIKSEKNVVRECQNWIFDCDYKSILRQGDVALLPLRRKKLPAAAKKFDSLKINNSHSLFGIIFFQGKNIYVKNPSIYHDPGTHPNYENLKGLFKVISGRRASFYDFAPPTVD